MLVCVRVLCDPLCRLMLHCEFVRDAAAARADVVDIRYAEGLRAGNDRFLIVETDVRPLDLVVFAAMRTFCVPALHGAGGVGLLDRARVFHCRRRYLAGLCVVKGGLSSHGQIPGIALRSGARRPTVALVAEHVADWLGREGVRLGGAAHRENAAGIGFLQDRVAAVAALRRRDLFLELRTVAEHRGDTELGVLRGVSVCRVDKQDRAGVLVDDVADTVVQKFGFADLRRGDHHDMPHLRIVEAVHRLHEVRRPGVAPRAGLGRGFSGQAAVLRRPFGYG